MSVEAAVTSWLCGKSVHPTNRGTKKWADGALGDPGPGLGVGVNGVSILPTATQRLTLRKAHHGPKLLMRKKLLVQLRGRQGHLGLGKGGGSWKPGPPMLQ